MPFPTNPADKFTDPRAKAHFEEATVLGNIAFDYVNMRNRELADLYLSRMAAHLSTANSMQARADVTSRAPRLAAAE